MNIWKINLKGKLRNTSLPTNKALLPLFEAIVNSFQSINVDSDKKNKYIDIFIERDETQLSLDNNDFKGMLPIKGFKIIDNGVGFNNINMISFITPESMLKDEEGGKGIGRFLWLKAFDNVNIDSSYTEEGKYYKRSFNFNDDSDEMAIDAVEVNKQEIKTSIHLQSFKTKYRKYCQANAATTATIAYKIIEHCLIYLLSEDCPKIRLIDSHSSNQLNNSENVFVLNDIFKQEIIDTQNSKIINVKAKEFNIRHFKIFSSEEKKHKISFIANDREVESESENLSKHIPNLSQKIKEGKRSYVNVFYVSSKYLNGKVDNERTKIDWIDNCAEFQDETTKDEFIRSLPDEISKKELIEEILQYANLLLKDYIIEVNANKIKEYSKFIKEEAPKYRYLLKHKKEDINNLKPNLSVDKLDIELHKIFSKTTCELKEEGYKLLDFNIKDIEDYNKYKEGYKSFINKYDDLTKDVLTDYIIHRRLIIDLLENNLKINKDGKYDNEDCLHSVFFPMKTTSDDIIFEDHNLWLIDEKLSFHKYLYSDQSFKQMDKNDIELDKRPDMLIYHNEPDINTFNMFNNPMIYNEDSNYSPITIIEFKKPWRKNYTESEDPFKQVYGYAQKIRAGNLLNEEGRPITKNNAAQIYIYLVCDFTPKMRSILDLAPNLTPTPDKTGYFGYHTNPNINASIEVISYDALIDNAIKRNQILFEKLGLQAHKTKNKSLECV